MDGPILNESAASAEQLPPGAVVALSRELLHAARDLGPDADALDRVRALALRARGADPARLADSDERTAFWLNVYNALAKHALHLEKAQGNLLLKLGLFSRSAYEIGGLRYSLNHIEHGLLRGNRRPPNGLLRTLSDNDPRRARAPSRIDARVHFALNCGARSCPPIRSYDPARLDAQLDTATRAYFESECSVDRTNTTITLPKLCKYYKIDFGTPADAVRFAARHLPDPERDWILQNAARLAIRYADYDWSIVTATPAAE